MGNFILLIDCLAECLSVSPLMGICGTVGSAVPGLSLLQWVHAGPHFQAYAPRSANPIFTIHSTKSPQVHTARATSAQALVVDSVWVSTSTQGDASAWSSKKWLTEQHEGVVCPSRPLCTNAQRHLRLDIQPHIFLIPKLSKSWSNAWMSSSCLLMQSYCSTRHEGRQPCCTT